MKHPIAKIFKEKNHYEIRVYGKEDQISLIIKIKNLELDPTARNLLLNPIESGNQK